MRSSIPDAADFANYVVAKIPAEWNHVAIQLGLSIDECDAIKKNDNNCHDQFMAVFREWARRSHEPYFWSTLITPLKSPGVDRIELAEKLQYKFCS